MASNFKNQANLKVHGYLDSLVKHETGLSEKSKNFRIAKDYLIGNLNSHNFQDPDSHKIKKHLNGLIEKLNCNSQITKSKRLDYLISHYLEKSSCEYKYAKLFLLSLISTSPLHSEYTESPISNDLAKMLQESSLQSLLDNQISDWDNSFSSSSSLNDSFDIDSPKDPKKLEQFSLPKQASNPAPLPVDLKDTSDSEISSEEDGRSYDNPCSLTQQYYESHSDSIARKAGAKNFVLPWTYDRVSEREILDKAIMMLLGFDTDVFSFENGAFRLAKRVEFSHMTPTCLQNYLNFFITLGTQLRKISEKGEELKQDPCITFQYFGEACLQIYSGFRKEILSLQNELIAQSGCESRESLQKFPQQPLTLISLKCLLIQMSDHSELIQLAISSLPTTPVMKSSGILNYLYNLIQSNYSLTDHSSFTILVRIFLMAVKPFIEDLSNWLSQGSVTNLDVGFMIEKSKDLQSIADSWESTFVLRKNESGPILPVFVSAVSKEILTIGKNMMLIRKIEDTVLDRVLPPPSTLLIGLQDRLQAKLLEESSHFLNACSNVENIQISSISWNCNKPEKIALPSVLTTEKFQMVSKSTPPDVLTPCVYKIPAYSPKISSDSFSPQPVKSWISFQHVLDTTICATIRQLHTDTCQYVLTLLQSQFNLNACFKSLREVFLMENAENMRPLIKFINKKADLHEMLEDSYELSNAFRESMKLIKQKGISASFSCALKSEVQSINTIESLECIRVQFISSTPLEICFDEGTLAMYQRLFTRILQIKRALHCAKSLKWRSKEHSGFIHKPYLVFQKKLIHFVTCFEEYVMQDVLHTCAMCFNTDKSKVNSVDELRVVHQKYLTHALDRCLLSSKTSPLSNAVNAVFGCCIRFFELMKKVGANELYEKTLEGKNSFEDIQNNFETANRILLQVLSKNYQNRRNLQYLNSYFSMNFNRFYIYD